MLLLAVKYMACKLLTDAASRERVAAASRCTLNRFEITIKVLQFYIFAMLFAVLKDMACKLLTDTAIKTISNNYPCQVPLDTTTKSITTSTRVSY